MRLVVATGNAGKLAEIRSVLDRPGLELLPQRALGIADAEENGASFVENALIKARHAARASGLPALADDSGLLVDALGGEPGLHSAHWAGVHGDAARNVAKLLAALDGVPEDRRGARFHCVVVVLRHAADPLPLIAEGSWYGRIATRPRGDGGFGYDPVFVDAASGLTAAELPPAAKHARSHRGQALAALKTRWAAW